MQAPSKPGGRGARSAGPLAIVATAEMSDENLCRHLNKRHTGELGLNHVNYWKHASEGYYASLRAYHDRLHRIATPIQYDHEHTREQHE